MPTTEKDLIGLETQFWQALVDQDADAAIKLLSEPALMVSSHGAMQFDHAGYRKMVDKGAMIVTSYEFSGMKVMQPNPTTAILTYGVKQVLKSRETGDSTTQQMNDSSTWIKVGTSWKCVMHTESPAAKEMAHA
jgi:hypothetical protein